MKVILSRKGFDNSYGGQPSPILPDGTLLSFPIPAKDDLHKFTDLRYRDKSLFDIIKELKPNSKIKEKFTCHLDPDIREDMLNRPSDWKGVFGQHAAAQGHLSNQNVASGDLFLFFGWFKQTEIVDGKLKYVKGAPDLQLIYGYLEIDKIIIDLSKLPSFAASHPHAENRVKYKAPNALYIGKDKLSFNQTKPGYGNLIFKDNLVLTAPGMTRSKWLLPDFFQDVSISYHKQASFKNEYFQSAHKGQEFVIESNKEIIDWAQNLILQ